MSKRGITFVIPMAGCSSRFVDVGIVIPKYMLYCGVNSLFRVSLSSFIDYWEDYNFLFICRDIYGTPKFIDKECEIMGIRHYKTVVLDKQTSGQAETVYLGLQNANLDDDEEIIVFNIDTHLINFVIPNIENCDGWLQIFKGSGKNWSYALTENENSTKVVRTAEKEEISDNCSSGLYYFKKIKDFNDAYENYSSSLSEAYVAPLYNYMIHKDKDIRIVLTSYKNVEIIGTPQEYTSYLQKYFSYE